jgi:HSP20 family molecular chaperone IbpA
MLTKIRISRNIIFTGLSGLVLMLAATAAWTVNSGSQKSSIPVDQLPTVESPFGRSTVDSQFDDWWQGLAGRHGWGVEAEWPWSRPTLTDSSFRWPPLALPDAVDRMGGESTIVDEGDRLIVAVVVPGLSEGSVEVEAAPNSLRVTGEQEIRQELRDADGHVYSISRSRSRYARSFTLPSQVRPDGMETRYHEDTLRIILPKVHQEA